MIRDQFKRREDGRAGGIDRHCEQYRTFDKPTLNWTTIAFGFAFWAGVIWLVVG